MGPSFGQLYPAAPHVPNEGQSDSTPPFPPNVSKENTMYAPRRPTPLLALLAVLGVLGVACADSVSPHDAAPEVLTPASAALGASTRPSFGVVAGGGYGETFNFAGAVARFDTTFGVSSDGGPPPITVVPVWALVPPAPWRPTDFDVTIHSRDVATWYTPEPFRAMHGTLCQPFQTPEPANAVQPGDVGTHHVQSYDDLNYRCRNHMMTAIKATGYGAIYVTPNALVDFAAGEAVIKFALSTLRTSGRDWVDLWITPWEDNLKLPLDGSLAATDLQGPPRRAIHVRMTAERTRSAFEAYYVENFTETKLPTATALGYESIVLPVSTRRDSFELRISRTRLKFGMRKVVATANEPANSITWIDTPIPPLAWTQGVVQFGHHSFNPESDGGTGGTWHWDDFTIAPAVPFTIVKATRRYADGDNNAVGFASAAPANAFLRFAGYGEKIEVSFDGKKWEKADRQAEKLDVDDRFHSYWTPVPAGTTSVLFRAKDDKGKEKKNEDDGPWLVRDIAIWSR